MTGDIGVIPKLADSVTGETLSTPFYLVNYDFVLQKTAIAKAA